jgi:hypothetical protein
VLLAFGLHLFDLVGRKQVQKKEKKGDILPI